MKPLKLTSAASTVDSGNHKKILVSGTTALIIWNKKMEDIMKIVKSYEKSGLLMKGAKKTIENEEKNKKMSFLSCY